MVGYNVLLWISRQYRNEFLCCNFCRCTNILFYSCPMTLTFNGVMLALKYSSKHLELGKTIEYAERFFLNFVLLLRCVLLSLPALVTHFLYVSRSLSALKTIDHWLCCRQSIAQPFAKCVARLVFVLNFNSFNICYFFFALLHYFTLCPYDVHFAWFALYFFLFSNFVCFAFVLLLCFTALFSLY